jgi:hypothetical protein
MNFKIETTLDGSNLYFIALYNNGKLFRRHTQIFNYLNNIELEEYINILLKWDSYKEWNNCYYFKSQEDAQSTIEELEPYLILKLLGD